MSSKIVVGPVSKGHRNDVLPFNIDNDSFPVINNAYQWRWRVKRKRGTTLLGRLTRPMSSSSLGNTDGSGAFSGNIISILSLEADAQIKQSSISVTIGAQVFTDDGLGTLSNGGAGTGTINYSTGALTIQTAPVLAATAVTITFAYFPDLPVMGLEDFVTTTSQFPGTIAFDTVYSYNIETASPYANYNVSYYKNPATGSYTGYTQKTTWTALTWNGQDYQQFWTTNYQGAMWATNGIEVPFDITNIGMQYKAIVTTTIVAAGPPARVTLQITGHGLVVGDFVFVNEVLTTTGINFQTGFVDTVTDGNNVIVQFPSSTVATNGTGGIAQYLTNRSDATKDCIRFYDGTPVTSATPPVFNNNAGWVNFCPPLISEATTIFSISDLPPAQYYLVGARLIIPFKDRLLFFGPVVQTSTAGSQKYLQDTVIYSQNGTPYYTCTFPYSTVTPLPSIYSTVTYTPILLPTDQATSVSNQTANAPAFFEDLTGFGGFVQAGIDEPINTIVNNEDVLLVGFTNKATRFTYTGNDIVPFNFFIINSELGSTSTFSAVTMDRGGITIGNNGIVLTTQISSQRIDLDIPDEVFQFNLLNNGTQRVCAQRDFINEWIYFTYSPNFGLDYFPGQTLLYNYRDNSWGKFIESYTTYGQFRKSSAVTWDSLTDFVWDDWDSPWDGGDQTAAQPLVIAGNQQGFVMIRESKITSEDPSGFIQNIDSSSVVTSAHHNLNDGDFIIITGALGTISQYVNGKVFSVANPATNTFTLNPTVTSGTYLGGGVFTRLYVPEIQSKQFPTSWDMARKTRIAAQQYLLTKTDIGQITLLIFLSQDSVDPFNDGPVFPLPNYQNSAIIYSTVLHTCPESTNLGLTPANSSLMMLPDSLPQGQIWHRMNTSLIGDTVQIGFTLSDEQMRTFSEVGDPLTITGATQTYPCVLTCNNALAIGAMVKIEGVEGMTELNFTTEKYNIYMVTAVSSTTITIDVDATAFTAYLDEGTVTQVAPVFQTDEIELHGFILGVSPSQLLA